MIDTVSTYPETRAERDKWIVERRGQRNVLDPWKPYAFFVEEELSSSGNLVPVATVFLTNRECPWRCVMCDLWKNTLQKTAPTGAIPAQIDYALQRLPPARQVKLYNSGSFFDPRAIPLDDYPQIAKRIAAFDRVIVESHPALIADNCFRFNDLVSGKLEVAMGLETAHPPTLQLLNKGMTLDQFSAAAEKLLRHNINLRVFILVTPPYIDESVATEWARRSIDFAFDCGASAVSLIPARGGNGAMEELAAAGSFHLPRLQVLEAAVEYGLSLRRGRVFADLWDMAGPRICEVCGPHRLARLQAMNNTQTRTPNVQCELCGATT
jgi:radical SAM enzyme (TIGR01210 family)